MSNTTSKRKKKMWELLASSSEPFDHLSWPVLETVMILLWCILIPDILLFNLLQHPRGEPVAPSSSSRTSNLQQHHHRKEEKRRLSFLTIFRNNPEQDSLAADTIQHLRTAPSKSRNKRGNVLQYSHHDNKRQCQALGNRRSDRFLIFGLPVFTLEEVN